MARMAEERFIQFQLPDETGKIVTVRLFASQFDKFAAGLLHAAASIPQPPSLSFDIQEDPAPAPASAIGISPISGTSDQARLSICVGPIALQVAVPLSDLMKALEDLNQTTEPDPTSFRRPS